MPESFPIRDAAGRTLNLWPGSEWARNAIPVDYPISRDLRPRWGYGRPPFDLLAERFAADRPRWRDALREMRGHAEAFRRIPPIFDDQADPRTLGWLGGATSPADAAMLYTMVARYRPRRLIEIGSGKSTLFARRAALDHHTQTHHTVIDPRPAPGIDAACDALLGCGLEQVDDLAPLTQLEPGDILFIDGSHRSFQNSDVTVAFLELIPRLRPGVVVHVHDIWLPLDYPPMFLHWYWNEQYLLAAYLLGARERVEVLFPGQFVATDAATDAALLAPPIELPGAEPYVWRDFGCFWFTHRGQ